MGTGAVALAWLIIGLLMLLAFGYIGKSSDKGWLGVLIDNRNMMSLSRLQIILCTVALASGISAAEISKFYAFPDVPAGLLAMIGISHGGYLTAKAFTHTTPE